MMACNSQQLDKLRFWTVAEQVTSLSTKTSFKYNQRDIQQKSKRELPMDVVVHKVDQVMTEIISQNNR